MTLLIIWIFVRNTSFWAPAPDPNDYNSTWVKQESWLLPAGKNFLFPDKMWLLNTQDQVIFIFAKTRNNKPKGCFSLKSQCRCYTNCEPCTSTSCLHLELFFLAPLMSHPFVFLKCLEEPFCDETLNNTRSLETISCTSDKEGYHMWTAIWKSTLSALTVLGISFHLSE